LIKVRRSAFDCRQRTPDERTSVCSQRLIRSKINDPFTGVATDDDRIFVISYYTNSISQVDPKTNAVVKTITSSSMNLPDGIAIH